MLGLKETIDKDISQCSNFIDTSFLPLFTSHNSLVNLTEKITPLLPFRNLGKNNSLINKVFAPFAHDGFPFWPVNELYGCFNHKYEPLVVTLYVVRDHLQDFYDFCNGYIISNEKDYNHIRSEFNKTFTKVLQGYGNGPSSGLPRGYCSVDEMIRMGCLFFLLMKSCSHAQGLVLDSDRRFMNNWNGRMTRVAFNTGTLRRYSEKLKGVFMSGLDWRNFIFRYMEETDENSLWFFQVPQLGEEESIIEQEFTHQEFFDLFSYLAAITNRGGYSFIIFKEDEELGGFIKDNFNFGKFRDGISVNNYLYYYRDILKDVCDYSVVSNYNLDNGRLRVLPRGA
jgi:hypothetical protein